MIRPFENILFEHISSEKEQIHLLTTLYGITVQDNPIEPHLRIAKCLELMKASTLIIDDIIDKSTVRNGLPSLYIEVGVESAILIAEILKSTASIELCQSFTEIPGISDEDRHICFLIFEDTYRTVCLGQLEDTEIVFDKHADSFEENKYWNMIEKTTAVFIQLPLRLGSTISHLDEPQVNALINYGQYLGLAYQVRDDVIDLIGDPEVTGKQIGSDIKDHKFRLPLIHCFRNCSKINKDTMIGIIEKNSITDEDVHLAVGILWREGSISYCLEMIEKLCVSAIESLSTIKNSFMKKQLIDVANLVIPEDNLFIQMQNNI